MIRAAPLLATALATAALLAGAAAMPATAAEARPGAMRPSSARKPAPIRAKPELYDPERLRAGSRPGFIDLGNGTEVRVSGRVRLDYDVRR